MGGTNVKALVLNILFVAATLALNYHPCKVDSVILQPQFGISARTRKLVDILQAPPLITQKLHAEICSQSDTHLIQHFDKPRFICRQRYSITEVFSKSREDLQGIQGLQPFIKLSGEQLVNDFVKDFVIIESGCDVFINFHPSRVFSRFHEKELKKTAISGIASIHGAGVNTSGETQGYNDMENSSVDYFSVHKRNSMKPRSMIRNGFFRKGMHLNSEHESISNSTNIANTQNIQSSTTIPKVNDVQQATEDNLKLAEGEFRLTPDTIGLPLLILESSIDPVMKIISHSIK